MKEVVVVGAGFGGLASAALLAKKGLKVTLLEKNPSVGGRAMYFREKGFLFDRGPSWYLMPEVFERFFAEFGKKPQDFFELKHLSPLYKIFYEGDEAIEVPSAYPEIRELFGKLEPAGEEKLDKYLSQAKYKYDIAMKDFLYKDYSSFLDLLEPRLALEGLRLHLFESIDSYAKRFFKSPKARKILEYTMVFLGGSPYNTPALYSIMSHVDLALGVWYPMGGMAALVDAMEKVCRQQGVEIITGEEAKSVNVSSGKATSVSTENEEYPSDIVLMNADYHHAESLLPKESQTYSRGYWRSRAMAPSALLLHLGVDHKLDSLQHHNLVLADNWESHFDSIFRNPSWPKNPSYYLGCPSRTDPKVAPKGKENLFFLVPVASGLEDDEKTRNAHADKAIAHFEKTTGESIKDSLEVKHIKSHRDFSSDFNAYKGTALGLAHTLFQTASFRPSMRSGKVKNLYYCGHYTHPGVGVPMVLIASQAVSEKIVRENDR